MAQHYRASKLEKSPTCVCVRVCVCVERLNRRKISTRIVFAVYVFININWGLGTSTRILFAVYLFINIYRSRGGSARLTDTSAQRRRCQLVVI